MRIVLTGAAGFIGSHLGARLLASGADLIAIDNLRTGSERNLSRLEEAGATILRHDVSEPLFLEDAVDAVLHLASPASPMDFTRIPIPILKANAIGSWHMLGLAKAKSARFLLTSTSEVYGDPLVHPQPETYLGNVNPVGIRGVYDESKRFAEAITMAYHRSHGIDTRIARIFNTYGPGMRTDDGRAVPAFIDAALKGKPLRLHGGGSTTRSFCYIDDMVDGLIALLDLPAGEESARPVNLGNPDEVSMKTLAELIVNLTGSSSELEDAPLPPDDPLQRMPDITRARTILGWEPKIDLEEGLIRTIEAARAGI